MTGHSMPRRRQKEMVTCSACKHAITGEQPVAHCPACGWQERRGAD